MTYRTRRRPGHRATRPVDGRRHWRPGSGATSRRRPMLAARCLPPEPLSSADWLLAGLAFASCAALVLLVVLAVA